VCPVCGVVPRTGAVHPRRSREPDLIIGSWCGKKFRPERIVARDGFDRIRAVQHQDLYEIKSSLILQPGPAALSHRVMRRCLLGVHIAFITQAPQLLDQYRLSVSPFSTVV
jgi:hypothetical protein